jgi:hypothetical protein
VALFFTKSFILANLHFLVFELCDGEHRGVESDQTLVPFLEEEDEEGERRLIVYSAAARGKIIIMTS